MDPREPVECNRRFQCGRALVRRDGIRGSVALFPKRAGTLPTLALLSHSLRARLPLRLPFPEAREPSVAAARLEKRDEPGEERDRDRVRTVFFENLRNQADGARLVADLVQAEDRSSMVKGSLSRMSARNADSSFLVTSRS